MKTGKRTEITAILLTVCLLLGGCGEVEEQKEGSDGGNWSSSYQQTFQEPQGTYYYVAETDLQITEHMAPRRGSMQIVGNTFYFANDSDARDSIYARELSLEATATKLPISFTETERLLGFGAEETGTVLCFVKEESAYFLRKFQMDGVLLWEQVLEHLAAEEEFYCEKVVIDAKGNIYVKSLNSLWIYNQSGIYLGRVEVQAPTLLDVAISQEGRAYVTYSPDDIQVLLAPVDVEQMVLGASQKIPGRGDLFTGISYGLLTCDSRKLYQISTTDYKSSELLDLVKHYIEYADICALVAKDTENLQLISQKTLLQGEKMPEVKWVTLTGAGQVPPNQQKKEIRVTSMNSVNQGMTDLIMDFNRQSEEYFASYEAVELWEEEDLIRYGNTVLVSGDCPDVICGSYYYYDLWAEGEILSDLRPYLSRTQFREEDYFESVLRLMEEEGELRGLSKSFSIYGMALPQKQSKALRKKEDGVSVDAFLRYLEKNPEVKFAYDGEATGLLKMCLRLNLDSFMDRDEGNCHFSEEEFRELLLRLKQMGSEHYVEPGQWEATLNRGEPFIAELFVHGFEEFERAKYEYGTEMTMVGFPSSEDTVVCELIPSDVLMVPRTATNKEGAMVFAEYYMAHYESMDFPTNRKLFDRELEQSVTKQYEKDGNGEATEKPIAHYFSDNHIYPIYPISRQDAEMIETLIHNAKPFTREDNRILNIVLEEASFYFYGQKSLDEVTAIIQSRVQLYLDERNL